MLRGLIILILCLCLNLKSDAQDTLIYDIKAGTIYLGEVIATRHVYGQNDSIRYRFESQLKVFSFYRIHYLMESVFTENIMQRSLSKIDVNNKIHHYCNTQQINNGYQVINPESDTIIYSNPILSSVTPYYFNNYHGPDTIFSEYSGRYRAFVKRSNNSYILHPDDPMEFYFNDLQIVKVTVPNSILDFHIELQK